MNKTLSIKQRNSVLLKMAELVEKNRAEIIAINQKDLKSFEDTDLAMYDRLKVDDAKIEGMIESLNQLVQQEDPLGKERFSFVHENGLRIENRTAPFGTILIIYESRPDVTIEAAGIAFKSGNKILLKGGKESFHSNKSIVKLWREALKFNSVDENWVEYLVFNREETQEFLKNPTQKIDLIIPRGGEKLIQFVKENATCPVIVSGRGNNFIYLASSADQEKAIEIIVNAKVAKISACNALDKVLIDRQLPNFEGFLKRLIAQLMKFNVQIWGDETTSKFDGIEEIEDQSVWYEEFLDYKIVIGRVEGMQEAIDKINQFGGGHSACILTKSNEMAREFMDEVDAAAVYQNASTRFTDGFQFGLGGELAISTDKLHQRGPIGLEHLVTNKWYVYGEGQIR
ncbi:glutamate-5-semialdehyde dehydrogenase [Namhaeicola litoreus]|uniref:Gamma-glutamyl phosphate reductase n=1 Tax=Namhaeicola litoreus TaxID=1052145 RepID=A0ABW3Y080_9FLAO